MKVEGVLKILAYALALTGFLSVATHAGGVFVAGFAALMLPAAWRDWRRPFVVPRWILNALAVAMVIVTFLRLRIDNIVAPAVDILLVMIALKFAEDKQPRDYLQIFVLSLLLLAGSSLLSLDMIFLAYLIAFLFFLSSATVLLAYFTEDPALVLPRRTLAALTARPLLIPLVALPVTVLLFVLLPRTSHPFLDFLNRSGPATSGFTDHVRLGGVADIQEDATVAFRVATGRLGEDAPYWRGIVFDRFDGRTWTSLRTPPATTFHLPAPARRVHYTVYLEPAENRWLFTLDKPVFVSLRNARGGGDLVYTLPDPVLRKIRYEGVSVPADTFTPAQETPGAYLDLPPGLEDIRALTAGLTRGLAPLPAVQALHGYLHHGPFRYALSDLPRSSRPLQDFLFRHRYGNCEYFASAMTVMARSAGIPARMVGGYRGGYYHDLGGYYVVLQKNAHVWTEVWLEGRGWLRVDPTPAALSTATSAWQGGLGFRVRMVFDLLEYYWNINVIAYDLQKQFRLLTSLERTLRNPGWRLSLDPGQRLRIGGALLILLALAGALLLRRMKWPTPEERLLARFHRRLARLGHTRRPGEGLEAFIARLPADVPRRQAEIFVAEFERFYYKDIAIPKRERERLAALIRAIPVRRPEG